jgi:hypothetical protein
MVDQLSKCLACDGRGYFRCSCWPADCICNLGDEDCDECGGEGVIDGSYDDPIDCDCSNHDIDLAAGRAWCHVCGRHWTLSSAEIEAEIEHQRSYIEAETDAASACGDQP